MPSIIADNSSDDWTKPTYYDGCIRCRVVSKAPMKVCVKCGKDTDIVPVWGDTVGYPALPLVGRDVTSAMKDAHSILTKWTYV